MAGHGTKLTQRQELAISALLTATDVDAAAHQAGIGARTLYRWLREDATFQAAYRTAKRSVVEQAITQVQQATGKAVATLLAVMDDPMSPASSKVSAARAVLEQALRAVEIEELEARIAKLEAAHAPQPMTTNGIYAGRTGR